MMSFLPRWKITVFFGPEAPPYVLLIHDHHFSNVVRKLADVSFEQTPMRMVIQGEDQMDLASTNMTTTPKIESGDAS